MEKGVLKISEGQSPIDSLLAHLGRTETPLAQWEGRRGDPFLHKLALASAEWPGVFHRLADVVALYANYWCEEACRPIMGMRDIDRRGSFVGAFPWICDRFPWPQDGDGERNVRKPSYMSPILQLNLSELKLGPLGSFPQALFQVWGTANSKTYDRIIALEQIQSTEPNWTYMPWCNERLGYFCESFPDRGAGLAPTNLDWYEREKTGEYVQPDEKWRFSLGQFIGEKVEGWMEQTDSKPAGGTRLANKLEATANELEGLGLEAPQLQLGCGFFGGQLDAYYCSDDKYYDFDARTIYTPANAFDECSTGVGLRTLYRGVLGVMQPFGGGDLFSRLEY